MHAVHQLMSHSAAWFLFVLVDNDSTKEALKDKKKWTHKAGFKQKHRLMIQSQPSGDHLACS
jgi:hypothetical protein